MSKRTSGVKNLVSKIGDFSRGVPFIQPRSPTANGDCRSTSGAGAGACSASAIIGAFSARADALRGGADTDGAVGASAATDGMGADAAAGTFITTSRRVALLGTTCSEGTLASG